MLQKPSADETVKRLRDIAADETVKRLHEIANAGYSPSVVGFRNGWVAATAMDAAAVIERLSTEILLLKDLVQSKQ